MLRPQPRGHDLDVFTLLAPVIAVWARRWKVFIQALFHDRAGPFEGQRMASVACVKWSRALGELMRPGVGVLRDRKAERLGP